MASNDSLDDFFKKIDKKDKKHKKQQTLLTNNEELLKQLVIVTSATSAFKENMDFDDEDDEVIPVNNHQRHPVNDEINGNEDKHTILTKNQPYSVSVNNKTKSNNKLSVQDNNNKNFNDQQQDEWEEFEDSTSKYEQLRLKFSRATNNDDNEEYYDDEENNHQYHFDENTNHIHRDNDEQSTRNNRRREQQQQQKDKPVWNLDQVKQQTETIDQPTEKIEEAQIVAKSATEGAYRPPQLRGNSAITIVSGSHQRVSKKEKPNLASTEEFPTLGATINKK